jgi:hypothetical protein
MGTDIKFRFVVILLGALSMELTVIVVFMH